MFPANKQHEHEEHEKENEHERKRLLSISSSPGGYSYSSVPTPSSSSPYFNNNSYYRSMKRHPPQDAPGALSLSHSIPSTTRYERNSDYDYRSAFREIDRINNYNNDEIMNYGNGYSNNNDDDEELFREKRKKTTKDTEEREGDSIPSILIYTAINTIMCVPCLYGYSSVIFNNDVFQPHIDALSKLVLFSSIIHQICFTLFSSLPFAIGQVQDAGLIFLSIMSNTMANKLISEASQSQTSDLDIEEILSTVLVLLGVATSCLGLVLIVIGKFKLADLVAYLPLPVVGGYLAFIGYFCVEAGVSVCIQKSIVNLSDWSCLFSSSASSENNNLLMLAIPGLICGILFMIFARMDNSDVILPTSMVLLPIAFYSLIMFGIPDYNIEMARQDGWLGPHSNKIPAKDVFAMIHFDKVRWDMIPDILPTWVGMVFVVTFSSCLDVAAISMGLGEVLDVNNELTTVGISNLCSGILCGQTGSYIFSQTIFTMRAGLKTRWAGIFLIFTELAVFLATTSVLEVTPLFYLGGMLTFIGFDLLYEWLVEVRHKLLLSEYVIVLCTFIAIFIFGINGGILVGIIHSALDYIMVTAKASTLTRVVKRSRAVWNQEEWKFLDQYYQEQKIVTFEIKGNVFFGSSLQLFSEITNDISIHDTNNTEGEEDRDRFVEMSKVVAASPLHFHNDVVKSSPFINNDKKRRRKRLRQQQEKKNPRLTELHQKNTRSPTKKTPSSPSPDFVVLDLKEMQNVDASAARGCFLQLAKMCSKRGIILMASNATPHVDWLLRSHDAAFPITEQEKEEEHKRTLLFKQQQQQQPSFAPLNNENENDESSTNSGKIILFETLEEALEFCESCLMERFYVSKSSSVSPMTNTIYNNNNNNNNNINDDESLRLQRRVPSACALSQMCDGVSQHKYTLSCVFHQYLGLKDEEVKLLENYDKNENLSSSSSSSLHEEICLKSGEVIFQEGEDSDAFYLILSGSVVLQKNQPTVYPISSTRERDISSSSHNNTNNDFEEDNNNAMQLGGDNHQYHNTKILSGAGPIIHHTPAAGGVRKQQESYNTNESNSSDRNRSLIRLGSSSSSSKKYLRLGSLFGFVSYILEKKRNFSAIARNDDTIVAKISRDTLSRLSRESPDLEKLVVKLLLQASTRELDNVQDL